MFDAEQAAPGEDATNMGSGPGMACTNGPCMLITEARSCASTNVDTAERVVGMVGAEPSRGADDMSSAPTGPRRLLATFDSGVPWLNDMCQQEGIL
jgi:hypothetical protein